MSDPVMITLIICFTVIFVFLILAVIARWFCIVILNNRQNKPMIEDDEYLTIDEFQEYEHTIAAVLRKLEDKIDHKDKDSN